MLHSRLQDMLDEMLENPDDLFVSSNSKHCALVSAPGGAMLLLEGDFSGPPEEYEDEVHRIMKNNRKGRSGDRKRSHR